MKRLIANGLIVACMVIAVRVNLHAVPDAVVDNFSTDSSSYFLGNIPVGSFETKKITIHYVGQIPVAIDSVAIIGNTAYSGEIEISNPEIFPKTLTTAGKFEIAVRFSPKRPLLGISGKIKVHYTIKTGTKPESESEIPSAVIGNGMGVALHLEPPKLDSVVVGDTLLADIMCINTGTKPAELTFRKTNIFVDKFGKPVNDFFLKEPNSSTLRLLPQKAEKILIGFTPHTHGSRYAKIRLFEDGAENVTEAVGYGVAKPKFTLLLPHEMSAAVGDSISVEAVLHTTTPELTNPLVFKTTVNWNPTVLYPVDNNNSTNAGVYSLSERIAPTGSSAYSVSSKFGVALGDSDTSHIVFSNMRVYYFRDRFVEPEIESRRLILKVSDIVYDNGNPRIIKKHTNGGPLRIEVYPNPANGVFFAQVFGELSSCTIEVYSSDGRKVADWSDLVDKSVPIQKSALDLPFGLYYAYVRSGTETAATAFAILP